MSFLLRTASCCVQQVSASSPTLNVPLTYLASLPRSLISSLHTVPQPILPSKSGISFVFSGLGCEQRYLSCVSTARTFCYKAVRVSLVVSQSFLPLFLQYGTRPQPCLFQGYLRESYPSRGYQGGPWNFLYELLRSPGISRPTHQTLERPCRRCCRQP